MPDYQLKIALKATLAVLQFHSTPWLDETWMTSDLFLARPGLYDLREPRLFLRSGLSTRDQRLQQQEMQTTAMSVSRPQAAAATAYSARAPFALNDYCGINNATLFSLGVALLEIGHWKPLASLRRGYDPDDILTARRVAKQSTLLGTRYQEVVQKCLQCNFGFGTDLRETDLQKAVYNSVVCPLLDLSHMLEPLNDV